MLSERRRFSIIEVTMSIFVFDAYGTLFDVHAAIGRFRDQAGPDADRMS